MRNDTIKDATLDLASIYKQLTDERLNDELAKVAETNVDCMDEVHTAHQTANNVRVCGSAKSFANAEANYSRACMRANRTHEVMCVIVEEIKERRKAKRAERERELAELDPFPVREKRIDDEEK